MNSRHIWFALPAAVLTAAVVTQTRAPAQQAAPAGSTIAVIDIVKVFNSYQQTKELNEAFDRHRDKIKAEAEKRREVLAAKQETLKAYKIDHPDYKTLFTETNRLESDMKTWLALQEQDIMRKHKQWLQKTYENICDVAASIASKRGFQIILTHEELDATDVPDSNALRQQIVRRNVIYSSAQIDVTDDVLNELNLKYKSSGGVKITF